jgi:hypothetical protein
LVQVIDHINIPEQNNGLTGSSDGSRQHSWTKQWTDWFKWLITSTFLNKALDWLVQVMDRVNIYEQNNGLTGSSNGSRQHSWTKQWSDWFKWWITSIFPNKTMDWLVKLTIHINVTERTMNWLVEVLQYFNITQPI